MDENQVGKKGRARRSGKEVQRLVEEFVSGRMKCSEFCRTRGLSPGTLRRHLKGGKQEARQTPRLVAWSWSKRQPKKPTRSRWYWVEAEELKCVLDLTRLRCKQSSRSWKRHKASRVWNRTCDTDLPGCWSHGYEKGL